VNIFVRFGEWLEERRVLRQPDAKRFLETWTMIEKSLINRVNEYQNYNVGRFEEMKRHFEVLEAEKQIPSSASKEIQLLRSRLDRVELLVGLKREPVITNLPDAPRIS
jgi:hypothetical protein